MSTAGETIVIRPIGPDDSIDELTTLLHRSYAGLGNMGLNYTAVDQSAETTRERLSHGFAFVAIDPQGRLVGTIVFYPPQLSTGSPWLERPEVAHFGQFAVDPALQRRGIGSRLMDLVEEQARERSRSTPPRPPPISSNCTSAAAIASSNTRSGEARATAVSS